MIIYIGGTLTPYGCTSIKRLAYAIVLMILTLLGSCAANPVSSAFVQPADAPAAVTLSPATGVTQHSAVLSWSASGEADFDKYEVRMTRVPGSYGCSCTIIATFYSRDATSVVADGMDEDSTYYFIVRVYKDGGSWANSNEIMVKTKPGAADTTPPTIAIASPRNVTYDVQTVGIEWSASEAVAWAGYSLDGAPAVTMTGNATLEGLALGAHSLTVYANDSSMNTGSASVSFTVSIDLTPPTILHAPPSRANVGTPITFFAIIMDDTGVTGAQIYYRVAGETAFTMLDMLKCPDCVDSYNASIMAPTGIETAIEYYVSASDGNNTAFSPPGAPFSFHTVPINAPPPPVEALAAINVTQSGAILDWEASNASDFWNYAVYSSLNSSQWELLTEISARGSSFYPVTGLAANTTYYFRVRVYDTGSLYQDSGQIAVTTLQNNPVQPGNDASWLSQYGLYVAVAAIAASSLFVAFLMNGRKSKPGASKP